MVWSFMGKAMVGQKMPAAQSLRKNLCPEGILEMERRAVRRWASVAVHALLSIDGRKIKSVDETRNSC
jgi:hypothetical protein